MRQHIAYDQTPATYAEGLESIWADWDPVLRFTERMLRGGATPLSEARDEAVTALRRCQYRAHSASELAAGLRPPLAAIDAHEYLVTALSTCRDTLGVIAIRCELDELDEQTTEIGMHSASTTREAFQAARYSTVAAFHLTESLDPLCADPGRSEQAGDGMGFVLWGLVALCAVLFTVLLWEILRIAS